MQMAASTDRRRFPRREATAQIDVLGKNATYGSVLDVGAGGLRARLVSEVPRGVMRLVRVFDVHEGEYHRWAQVVWSTRQEGGYEVGLCFRQPLQMKGLSVWGSR